MTKSFVLKRKKNNDVRVIMAWVGPGQHPQYTRGEFGENAVGSSQYDHHSTPQVQETNEPNTLHVIKQSRMVVVTTVKKVKKIKKQKIKQI